MYVQTVLPGTASGEGPGRGCACQGRWLAGWASAGGDAGRAIISGINMRLACICKSCTESGSCIPRGSIAHVGSKKQVSVK